MTTYTVTQVFTKTPENIALNIGDTLVKYSDSVLVKIGTVSITSITFYYWIGSASSLAFMTASGNQCSLCYSGATGLNDYATIPTAWK